MRLLLMIFTMILFTLSCSNKVKKKVTDEVGNLPPYVTKKLLLNKGESMAMEKPIIYKDKLILFLTDPKTNEKFIKCFDKKDLQLLWTWNAETNESDQKTFGTTNFVHNNILAIAYKNYSIGINVLTGETVWEKDTNTEVSCIIGDENIIASYAAKEFNSDGSIRVANIETGNWNTIFNITQTDSLKVQLRSPLPFRWGEKQYVCFVSTKWATHPALRYNWLNLYNLTDERLEWVSDTIPLFHPLSGTPGAQPIFEDGQILLANDAIYSFNVEDGSLEWWKRYTNRFVFSTHIKSNEAIVYGNNESKHFIGLDVHTGQELFKTVTGGSASPIEYFNGLCFMTDVTQNDGLSHLMVLDALTGSIVHDLSAPYFKNNNRWYYSHANIIDSETGLYYTSDKKHLLIYDFNG